MLALKELPRWGIRFPPPWRSPFARCWSYRLEDQGSRLTRERYVILKRYGRVGEVAEPG